MNIISKIVDRTVVDYRERRFAVEDIFDEVWNDPFIEKGIAELSNYGHDWPVAPVYRDYIHSVIGRRLRRSFTIKTTEGKRKVREFWGLFTEQKGFVYARITLLSPVEMRIISDSYDTLSAQNQRKSKILVTLADEMEARGLKTVTDGLLKEVVQSLVEREI